MYLADIRVVKSIQEIGVHCYFHTRKMYALKIIYA